MLFDIAILLQLRMGEGTDEDHFERSLKFVFERCLCKSPIMFGLHLCLCRGLSRGTV